MKRCFRIPVEEICEMMVEYRNEHGNSYVPVSYETKDGRKLGDYLSNIRRGHKKVTAEELRMLQNAGYTPNITQERRNDNFAYFYREILKYKQKNGTCNVPYDYVTKSGYRLGRTTSYIRYNKSLLSVSQVEKLEKIGFSWRLKSKKIDFDEVYERLTDFKEKYGHCNVPRFYVCDDGLRLGVRIASIRYGNIVKSDTQKALLNEIGFVWKNFDRNVPISIDDICRYIVEYKNKYGHTNISVKYVTDSGVKLGGILANIRNGCRKITPQEEEKLKAVGMNFKSKRGVQYKNEGGN